MSLPLHRFLNVIYAYLVKDQEQKNVDELNELLWPTDPDMWGETPEAEAGQQAMMGLLQ